MQFRKRGLAAIVSLSPTGFFAFEAAIDNTLWVGLISVILLLLATEQTWMNNLKQRTAQSESYFTDISSDIQLRPSDDDKLRVARFPTHLSKGVLLYVQWLNFGKSESYAELPEISFFVKTQILHL